MCSRVVAVMKPTCVLVLVAGALVVTMASPVLHAQTDTASLSTPGGGGGGFYDYSRFGGIPMEVNIWGFVRSPGRYKVPSSTTLVELISLAGGPLEFAFTNQIRVVRDVTVDRTIQQSVVVYDMDQFVARGDTALNPILYPNSTVFVPGDSSPSTFSNTFSIVASIATLTLSIVGIFVALK